MSRPATDGASEKTTNVESDQNSGKMVNLSGVKLSIVLRGEVGKATRNFSEDMTLEAFTKTVLEMSLEISGLPLPGNSKNPIEILTISGAPLVCNGPSRDKTTDEMVDDVNKHIEALKALGATIIPLQVVAREAVRGEDTPSTSPSGTGRPSHWPQRRERE